MSDWRRIIRMILTVVLAAGMPALLVYGVFQHWRSHAYDEIILKVSRECALSPALVRAVIKQESNFNCRRVGKAGEIGLMQVMPGTAEDWAAAAGLQSFSKYELFHPETNLRAGSWYLQRAIRYWSSKPNPLPYALAEYNAGRSNVLRWAKNDRNDPNVFWNNITYPGTKHYVQAIMKEFRRLEGKSDASAAKQ